jgi:hypothetical protein
LDLVMENASDDVTLLAGEDYGYDGELEEIWAVTTLSIFLCVNLTIASAVDLVFPLLHVSPPLASDTPVWLEVTPLVHYWFLPCPFVYPFRWLHACILPFGATYSLRQI